MLSQKKLDANRRNAQRSTGPRSEAGKERAKQNSLKHGIYATCPVMPDENLEEFDAFRAQLAKSLASRDAMQQVLVDRIVSYAWRLRRLPEVEEWLAFLKCETFDDCCDRHRAAGNQRCAAESMALEFNYREDGWGQLSEYEQRLQRGMQSALRQLKQLQKEQRAQDQDEEDSEPDIRNTGLRNGEPASAGGREPGEPVPGSVRNENGADWKDGSTQHGPEARVTDAQNEKMRNEPTAADNPRPGQELPDRDFAAQSVAAPSDGILRPARIGSDPR